MKTTISKFVMTLAAALCLAAGLSAEPAQRVVVQVPFSFVAGSTRLPAGLYAVSHDDTDRKSVV